MNPSCVSGKATGVILGILFAICGSSIALASNPKSSAGSFASHVKTVQNPCANPMILSTGGLCCPLSPGSTEKCSQQPAQRISRNVSKMKALVVNGITIPLPIVTQMAKKGLRRSWSEAMQDRNLIVCGYGRTQIAHSDLSNTRFPVLHCLSNEAHFRYSPNNPYSKHLNYDPRKSNIRCYSNCFLTQGNVVASVTGYIDHSSHRAQLISWLIGQAPTSGAAYSLRVPETVPMRFPSLHNKIVHVPVFVTFVIKNGDLSDIQLAERKRNTGISTN